MELEKLKYEEYIELLKFKKDFSDAVAAGLYDTLRFDKSKINKKFFSEYVSCFISGKLISGKPVFINSNPQDLTNDTAILLKKLGALGIKRDCLNADDYIAASSQDRFVLKFKTILENDVVCNDETDTFEEVTNVRYDVESLFGDCKFGIYNSLFSQFDEEQKKVVKDSKEIEMDK